MHYPLSGMLPSVHCDIEAGGFYSRIYCKKL